MEPQSHRVGSKICFKSSVFQDMSDYYGRYTVNYSSNLFCTDANSHEISFTGLKSLCFFSSFLSFFLFSFSFSFPFLPFPPLPFPFLSFNVSKPSSEPQCRWWCHWSPSLLFNFIYNPEWLKMAKPRLDFFPSIHSI